MSKPNSVTKEHILGKIKGTTYTVLPNGRTTVCQITLENGFTVEGYSACVDAGNFDQAMGEKYAFENAFGKIWAFEGYLLAQKLWLQKLVDAAMAEQTEGSTHD